LQVGVQCGGARAQEVAFDGGAAQEREGVAGRQCGHGRLAAPVHERGVERLELAVAASDRVGRTARELHVECKGDVLRATLQHVLKAREHDRVQMGLELGWRLAARLGRRRRAAGELARERAAHLVRVRVRVRVRVGVRVRVSVRVS